MDSYVKSRNGATASLLPGLLANVGLDLNIANNNVQGKVQAEYDQWNNLYNAMKTHYGQGGNGAGDIGWAINWEWNTNNVKRAEIEPIKEKRQACSRPTGPASNSGVPPASGGGILPSGAGGTDSAGTGQSSPSPTSAPLPSSANGGITFPGMGSGSSAASVNTASIVAASSSAAASASMTKAAQPAASGACFPYHDVNDLKLASPGINGFCAGNQSDWKAEGAGGPASAAANNIISSGYTLAPGAPPECYDLYKNGHSDYVTLLCSAPLNQLVNDCPYNGGKISNACGEWWLQTCPFGVSCLIGCPGGNFPISDPRCGRPWPPPHK